MNTTETNKKLAKFLGFQREYLENGEMEFHNDWNWLMLVVDKIKESYWIDILVGTNTTIQIGEYNQQDPNIALYKAKGMVEATYNACSMFVDWYTNVPREYKNIAKNS